MHPLRIFFRPYYCTSTFKKLVWSTYNFSWRKSKLKNPKAFFLIIIPLFSLFIFIIFYARCWMTELRNPIITNSGGGTKYVYNGAKEDKVKMIQRQQHQHNNKVLGKLDIIDNILLDHIRGRRNEFTMTKLNLDKDENGDEKEKEKQFQNLNDPYNNRNDSVNGTRVSRLNEQRQQHVQKYCSCQKVFINYPEEEERELIPEECNIFQRERFDNSEHNTTNAEEDSIMLPHYNFKKNRKKVNIPVPLTWTRSRRNWIFFKTKEVNRSKLLLEWCPTYKAASSLWMSIFGKLAKILTPNTENLIHTGKLTFVKLFKDFRLNIPPNTSIDSKRGILINKYQMLIVRHPFERLLSAYRDKLEKVKGRDFYHRKYSWRIINGIQYQKKKSNSKETTSSSKNKVQIFHDALSIFLGFRNDTSNKSSMDDDTMEKASTIRTPTFNEFIQYLLTTDPRQMDEHWRPVYLDCSPCLHSFKLILKVETMDTDKELLFNILAPYYGNRTEFELELYNLWKTWGNKSSSLKTLESSFGVNDTMNSSFYYFNQISKSDLKLLYEVYRPDFELFQYSPEEYIKMSKG